MRAILMPKANQKNRPFGLRAKSAVTELITPAKAEAPAEVPVTKAVNEVKKAVAPICQQLTLDFGPDF